MAALELFRGRRVGIRSTARRCAALAALAIFALVLADAGAARAQSNYRLAPVGGRAEMLGGTGLAYGRDAAAAFLNPATAVLVDDQRLSFSVNFYNISFVSVPRWYAPGPIDRLRFGPLTIKSPTLTDLDFEALPSSLCIFFRAGDVKFLVPAEKDARTREARIGLCFATTTSSSFDFSAEALSDSHSPTITHQVQTVTQTFKRFSIGPTYAMHVSDALAIGASFHASLTNHRNLFAANATSYSPSLSLMPTSSSFYSSSRGDSFDLEALAGATLRFGQQTVALSLKSPSAHVYGVGEANRQSSFDGPDGATSLVSAKGSFVSRSPPRVALGTGVEGHWGMAELDATYDFPIDSYTAELSGSQVASRMGVVDDRAARFTLSQHAHGVVNFAAGSEINLSPHVSFLNGVSTDISALSKGALQGGSLFNYYPTRTSRVAASVGFSSHGDGGELLIGAELSAGWGERLAVNSYQVPPVLGTTGDGIYQVMFIFAGSTTLRTIRRAVRDVREVIEKPKAAPPPPPPPKPYNPRDEKR